MKFPNIFNVEYFRYFIALMLIFLSIGGIIDKIAMLFLND